ncbi:MAG: deoxyuridine 5'-triphosphate nucleotidohydrolase [Bacteroidaceae bacterium]|nr:deoxyuridine 5'-triphosphate nucleotidohydrolase [Bacteroidaceae bacterium]
MKKIKIKLLRGLNTVSPQRNSDWIDLRAAVDVKIEAGHYAAIPLGAAIQLPKGYEAIVAPRSSLFKHTGLLMANSIGIIDESYKGESDEWHFLAFATRNTVIHEGERICQFRIIKHQPKIILKWVQHLGNKNRGGIGSTGRL